MDTIGKVLIENLIAEYGINAVEDYVNSQKTHYNWEDDWGNLYETEDGAIDGVLNILYGEEDAFEQAIYQLFEGDSGDLLDWILRHHRDEFIVNYGQQIDDYLRAEASECYHHLEE